jgi:hypothetical protein
MDVVDIRTFVPCKDYEVSKAFYAEIGFASEHVTDDLTLFNNGDCFFFVQNFYNQDLANNFMLQVCVADIEAAYSLCSNSIHKTKITSVKNEPWGQVFYLWGPVGELLHITQLSN